MTNAPVFRDIDREGTARHRQRSSQMFSGAEFMEVFVGVGAARVRDLFEQVEMFDIEEALIA